MFSDRPRVPLHCTIDGVKIGGSLMRVVPLLVRLKACEDSKMSCVRMLLVRLLSATYFHLLSVSLGRGGSESSAHTLPDDG